MLKRILSFLTIIFNVFGLYNKNMGDSFRSGKFRTYTSNKNPYKDLTRISPSQASFISKRWLENMIVEITQEEKNDKKLERLPRKLFDLEKAHIVTNINQLEDYIANHRSVVDMYLSWMPLSTKNIKTPLFIIVGEMDNTNKIFSIKQLVQSPDWDNRQISSEELKNALIDYTSQFESTTIDLTYLFEHDLRYKLSWATWNLEFDADNNLNETKN